MTIADLRGVLGGNGGVEGDAVEIGVAG